MSESQDKSDDLIAELAKLMASNASGGDAAAPKPAVIKLPPLNEATVQTTPVRIPGMEPAKSAEPVRNPPPSAAAAPVRIPGMEKPAGIDLPPPPQPRPASQFDFGRPPSAAPVLQPEPLANWETPGAPKIKLAEPNPRPAAVQQLAAMKFDPVTPASAVDFKPAPAAAGRGEPKLPPVMPLAMEPAPEPMSSKPNTAPAGDDFNFDFGFASGGKSDGSAPKQPPAAANDPIADIIASEINGINSEPEPKPTAKAVGPQPIPVSVKPIVASPRSAASAVPVKPVSVSARPVEADRFINTPSFGKPSPIPHISTAKAETDPMEELEGLIGETLRSEHAATEKVAAPSAPPVVPPLNTSFGPRRANLKEKDREEPQVQSAEAAILAAAAASGSEVGRLDAPRSEDRPYRRMKVKPPKTSFVSGGARQYVGIAVAGTLLLAAGFGLYWVLGMGRDDPSTAPVLTADVEPAKVAPAVTANLTAEPSSPVFDEINGVDADGGETLVSRDETEGESVTEVARVIEPEEDASVAESGLANRKVRTVTVRPDGTIVSGDEAGAALLPVDRPDVPEIEGVEPIETASTEPEVSTDVPADDPLNALVAASEEPTTAPVALEEPAPLEVASIDAASATPPVFDAGLAAPMPMPRPADRDSMVGGNFEAAAVNFEPEPESAPQDIGVNEPASTPLVALASEEPAPTRSRGGAYVQLSSQKSEGDAQESLRATERRMAGMLNGASLEVRRVDLGAKGVWYRVVLPVSSFQDATQTCAAIKSNGGDCVAING